MLNMYRNNAEAHHDKPGIKGMVLLCAVGLLLLSGCTKQEQPAPIDPFSAAMQIAAEEADRVILTVIDSCGNHFEEHPRLLDSREEVQALAEELYNGIGKMELTASAFYDEVIRLCFYQGDSLLVKCTAGSRPNVLLVFLANASAWQVYRSTTPYQTIKAYWQAAEEDAA